MLFSESCADGLPCSCCFFSLPPSQYLWHSFLVHPGGVPLRLEDSKDLALLLLASTFNIITHCRRWFYWLRTFKFELDQFWVKWFQTNGTPEPKVNWLDLNWAQAVKPQTHKHMEDLLTDDDGPTELQDWSQVYFINPGMLAATVSQPIY